MTERASIYRTPDAEAALRTIYDGLLARWPLPFREHFVATTYGKVHVLETGPADGRPVVLLHASAMSAVSWLWNIDALGRFRTLAIDNPGEAGKSVLDDLDRYPRDGEALADLYGEIADGLGVGAADVVGASNGGFIALSVARHHPGRVRKLALLGPMGIVPLPTMGVFRMIASAVAPVEPMVRSTARWAIGEDPRLLQRCGDWFSAAIRGVVPRVARPVPLSGEALGSIRAPVLMILGDRDHLVGDPYTAARRARLIPDVDVEVLHSGHLVGVERSEHVNDRLVEFLSLP